DRANQHGAWHADADPAFGAAGRVCRHGDHRRDDPRERHPRPHTLSRRLRMIWTLGAIPITLLAIGTPIFVLLLTGGVLTFVFFLTVSPVAIHQIMFGGLENYALLAIPFFIFAGELMGAAGIADRLIVW